MTATTHLRDQAAQWLLRMRENMEAARPGNAWFAATLHPCINRPGPMAAIEAEERLCHFDSIVARDLIGTRWRDPRALKQRPWAVLIGQNGAGGFHFHGLLAVPMDQKARFLAVAAPSWRKVAPYGSIDLSELTTPENWVAYATRQLLPGQPVSFTHLPYVKSNTPLPFAARLPSPAHIPFKATSSSTALAA